MDQAAIEREAATILHSAGLPDDEPPDVRRVVSALLGPGSIVLAARGAIAAEATIARTGDRWRIWLRRGLDPVRARFVVAHELAHFVLGACFDCPPETERICDALGAAMLAPARYVARSPHVGTFDVAALADEAVVSDTCAALRFGEVLRLPVAVVCPRAVRLRGPAHAALSDEPTTRALAKVGAPGVRRMKLREIRRVALVPR